MRAAAVALLFLLLGVLASEPVLARKGFGQSGGRPVASGRVQSSPPSSSPRPHSSGHHRHGHHHHKSFVGVGVGFGYPWGWWYYCDASTSYYPYVRECPSGWQRVPASPAE